MERPQRHHHQPDSTHQVSRRGRAFAPRMGFAPEDVTFRLSIVTQAGSTHSSRTVEEVFKSPTPMGSESTCETSSPSPRTRKSDSSGAGADTRGEGESLAASTPERGHRRTFISRDDDMCSSETKECRSDTPPSSPGGNHNERSSDEEPWTWFDSPTRNGRTREQRRKFSFKIIVVFRGGWCDTSRTLLKGFSELNQTVSRRGGKLVAVSSQTQEQVAKAVREHKLTFQAFADPTNELIRKMNRRFGIRCTISTNDMVMEAYPNGMAQPCVFAVMTDESPDERSVLYKWERWQTIGSLKHETALEQIKQEIARRTNQPRVPSLGVPAPAPQSRVPSTIALQRPPTGRTKRRPLSFDPSSISVLSRTPYGKGAQKYNSAEGYRSTTSSRVSGYSANRAKHTVVAAPSALPQPETPRGRRSYSLASASSPRPSSPSPSVESQRGARTLSIDDVVDEAIKKGGWTKTPPHAGQRAPREGNSSARRERQFQLRFSSGGTEAAAVATATASSSSSVEERSGKVSRDFKEYGGAAGASSGRPLLRVQEATQNRVLSSTMSRWDDLGGNSQFEEGVRGESETKETVVPPVPSQQQQRWMRFALPSVGNGDARRPPTSQMSPRRHQQQQEAKKPGNRLSWSGVRKERHEAASGFGSGSGGGVVEGNGNGRDGFGVHEDRRGGVSAAFVAPAPGGGVRLFARRSYGEAREQPPPESGELSEDRQAQWSSSGDESSWRAGGV